MRVVPVRPTPRFAGREIPECAASRPEATTLAERGYLLKRLIDFVASPPPGNAVRLTLQDVALCALWLEAQSRRAPLDSAGQAVAQAVQRWIASPETPDLNTVGRRHQSLLRDLIDQLQTHPPERLVLEEVAFLTTVLSLTRQVGAHPVAVRAATLLEAYGGALEQRKEGRTPAPGLTTLERRVQYVTERDILAADNTFVRLLAGIELPCRGPVFKASANLRILGDVPDGCTVVVENEGCCCVDGYVMGRVLSRRQCEIRHNISGVAIVLTGHIRARGVINNAMAISKMGSVVCMNAQGPRLIFAGQSIVVTDTALMGRLVTRHLHVGREVKGSRLEIAGEATAQYYRHLGMSNVSIVLRRELSCADYGEVTGAELNQLLSRAYGLRRHARNFSHLAAAARREADHSAQSVLMFLFGGGEVQKRLESLLRSQRRHAFISHVVLNLRNMLIDAREELFEPGTSGEDGPPPSTAADTVLVAPLDDLEDDDLKAAEVETAALQSSLHSKALDRRQRSLLMETAQKKLAAMTALQAQMAEQVLQEERAMQNMEKYEQILAGRGRHATKLDVLNHILPALQAQPADSLLGKRLRSNFSVLALRNVTRAARRASECDQKAAENLNNFRAVSEQLGKDYQIRILENPEDEGNAARVTGRFEAGARIFMDEYIENIAGAAPDAMIITPNDDAIRTYLRSGTGTRFYTAE